MNSAFVEQSNAQSNRWWASIQDLPGLQYKLSDFTLPMISIGQTELGGGDNVSLKLPGDRLIFDEITLSFFVDKAYANYGAVYQWMRNNTKMNDPVFKDISVNLLDNQGQYQGLTFVFKDCAPQLLSPIQLDGEGATTDIVCSLTVVYQDMDIVRDSDNLL